jgi:hypothetical protein
MKNLLFIYNPAAGRGLIKQNLFEIIGIFAEYGYDAIVHPTSGTLDAFTAAESAPENAEMNIVQIYQTPLSMYLTIITRCFQEFIRILLPLPQNQVNMRKSPLTALMRHAM